MRLCFALLCLAFTLAAAMKPEPLPFTKVSHWPQEKVEELTTKLSTHREGWWVRIGGKIYSPMLDSETDSKADLNINHFFVVFGDKLPEEQAKLSVAHDPTNHVHILHSHHTPPTSPTSSRPLPIHSKMSLFVNIREQDADKDDGAMSLERELEEDEEDALNTVTDEIYMDEIIKITHVGSGPKMQRNVAAEGHTTAEKYLGCRMRQNNLHVQFVPFDANGYSGYDVVGCNPGADKKFMLVGAHYDTLPVPPRRSPGAMDDASGVAVVMLSMDATAGRAVQHTMCYSCFDGEELGLLGSRRMAEEIAHRPELRDNFLGLMTSDMSTGFKKEFMASRPAGWDLDNSVALRGGDEDQDGIHIDGDHHSGSMIKALGEVTKEVVSDQQMPILESEASIWNSDQKAFHSFGLKAVDICAANHRQYKYWHDDHNSTENLDPRIGAQITRAAIGMIFKTGVVRGERDMEEVTHANVPQFHNSKSFDELFGADVDCEQVLQNHDEMVARKKTQKAKQHQPTAEQPHHKAGKKGVEAGQHAEKHGQKHVAEVEHPAKKHRAATKTVVHKHMGKGLGDDLDASLNALEELLEKETKM